MRSLTAAFRPASAVAIALAVALTGLAGTTSAGAASAPTAVRPAASIASTTSAEATIRRYVTLVYRDLFQREPDAQGLQGWADALTRGHSRGAVADAITYSTEYRSRLVSGAYREFLGRDVDRTGAADWLRAMASGVTIQTMESGFLSSDEYYARAGGTDPAWVQRLYRHTLGREAAPAEVQAWVQSLARGHGRQSVAMGFLVSSERLGMVVDGYYTTLLGRSVDAVGRRSWVTAIQSGSRTESVIGGIVGSSEYYAKAERPVTGPDQPAGGSGSTSTSGPGATTPPSTTGSGSTPTSPPSGQLALPRVPWEGGPAYYARFPGLGPEWTDPGFFPVMYWGAYVDERDKARNNAAKGINLYGEVYAPAAGWQKDARAAGIEPIGHVLPDEADMWAGYGDARWTGKWGFQDGICDRPNVGCSPDMFRQLEAQRPVDGLMRYFNGGKGMTMWMPRETGAKFVDGESWPVGVATTSLYFYSDWNLHGGDRAWPGEATTFFGIPRDQVRRAANYGEAAMTRLRELDARNGERKPLGVLVELGQQSSSRPGDFGHATMTPDKIAGAVWSSLIHEARLVGYFSHAFGTQPTSDALNHPPGDPYYDAVKVQVAEINAQVKSLAPVLNTQSYRWDFGPGVSTMLKVHAGSAYVFTQQARAAHTSGSYTLTLPPGVTGTTVEVVGENRTIPVVGGRFTDSFAAEHTTHIYRVAL